MGHGAATYRSHEIWKTLLGVVEGLLYVVFVADCFVELAAAGASSSYYPAGGASLIVLLLIIGLVHRIRCGPDYQ